MSRIPLLKPEAMDAEQRRVYDGVLARTGRASGGPSIGYAYTPGLWEANNAVSAYLESKSSLSPRHLRLAALVTVRRWNSDFPWAAQARMALEAGLEREIVDAINARTVPKFASPEDQATYDVAREVSETGTITDATYKSAVAVLGIPGLVDTVGLIGQFTKTAMVANVAGATAPPDAVSKLAP